MLLGKLRHALFHSLLCGSKRRLVRGDRLRLGVGGRFVVFIVRARDHLRIKEGFVARKVGLVPLIDGLRLLELGGGAVKIVLRSGK